MENEIAEERRQIESDRLRRLLPCIQDSRVYLRAYKDALIYVEQIIDADTREMLRKNYP